MTNMSYCRFQNTLGDLRDCHGALADYESQDGLLSEDERYAKQALIELCKTIVEEYGGCDSVTQVETDDDNVEIDDNVRYPEIEVQLTGIDGNAFSIMGVVKKALKRNGVSQTEIDEYFEESTSGDYDHVITTAMRWVTTY